MSQPIILATFTDSGVRVEIAFSRDAQGDAHLSATFTPTEPTFHLYANSLPRAGIEGVGRPTLLEIVAARGIEVSGPLSADTMPLQERIDGFDQPFAIYPDGPVTLRQPIRFTDGVTAAAAELAITYMACSSQGLCLAPVEDRRLNVTIPLSGDAATNVSTIDEGVTMKGAAKVLESTLGYDPTSDPFVDLERTRTQ